MIPPRSPSPPETLPPSRLRAPDDSRPELPEPPPPFAECRAEFPPASSPTGPPIRPIREAAPIEALAPPRLAPPTLPLRFLAPAPPLPFSPASERLVVLDALRGFALLGILFVNIVPWFAGPPFDLRETWTGPRERAVFYWVDVFASGKFFTLFSLLFGIGFAIQFERAESRRADFVPFFVRRLLALFLFGAIHAVYLSPADILMHYAILGVPLLLVRRLPARVLAPAALLLLAFGIRTTGMYARSFYTPFDIAYFQSMEFGREGWIEVFAGTDFVAMTRLRLLLYAYLAHMEMYFSFPEILAMFAAGTALWKADAFRRPRLALWLPIGLAGLAAGLWGNFGFAELRDADDSTMGAAEYLARHATYQAAGGPGFCLLYASIFVGISTTRPGRAALALVAPAGRMALTNYVGQSLICGLIFHGYGLGLYGRVPPSECMAIALGVWLFQLAASALWLRRFRFGPLERVWRVASYGPGRAART